MAGTPVFVITSAGLAAASVATPTGPYIHIIQFSVGSAYGYSPTSSDTGLNGNTLYTGTAAAYEYIGNNTLNIICNLPPDAGPFEFGEVALWLDNGHNVGVPGAMFAKAVFETPQTKYSSLGTNVVSSYTFNCLLKLQQSTAVFQIDTSNGPPTVADIYQWSDVYPPGVSANPDVPLYNVRELNAVGDATLLQNASDASWSVGTAYRMYNRSDGPLGFFPVANSTTSWIEIAGSYMHPADLSTGNRVFLIKTPDGFFRSVANVIQNGGNYRLNLNVTNDGTYNNYPLPNAPSVGSFITIYRDDISTGRVYYSQIIDPPAPTPPPPLATVGNPGLATASSGLAIQSAGVMTAYGMLQSPSQNTGRILTSGDNLNNFGLPSGLFITYSASYGYPANMPVSHDCQIWIHNNEADITQVAYPMNTGGGDGAGNGGYPPYWRQGYNGNSWTNWFPLFVNGKQGMPPNPVFGVSPVHATGQANGASFTAGAPGSLIVIFSGDGNPGQQQSLSINGGIVAFNNKSGGGGYGRRILLGASFNQGDVISANNQAGGIIDFHFYYYTV